MSGPSAIARVGPLTTKETTMTKTMLYKHPGKHKVHGNMFDHIVTEDIDAALKDGWFLTTPEALKGGEPKETGAPSRKEVKQKADELGIKYAKNIRTETLQKRVEDFLDGVDKTTVS
jgi:hypothetical protein